MKKQAVKKVSRNAENGQFTTRKYAEKYPATTVVESVRVQQKAEN